ncbi:MAG: SBBP repeat-containing protein [bacterium]|nr:SBBP repeat-containing protein [bacterium]
MKLHSILRLLVLAAVLPVLISSETDAIVRQEWAIHYWSHLTGGFSHVALDSAQNIYTLGSRWTSTTSTDFVINKYAQSGNRLWTTIYTGAGNDADVPSDFAVDAVGNVYVTGWSSRFNTVYDYATIKISADGVQQWVAWYDGPNHYVDIPQAIALSPTGDIYVTGLSTGSGTSYDFATVKYNAVGVQQWSARYNGVGNGDDQSEDIVVDPEGNIYVTGPSDVDTSSAYNSDFVTLKYDSSGILLWEARYGTPTVYDRPSVMASDSEANVYVAGTSEDLYSTNRIVLVKYNPSGTLQWSNHFDISLVEEGVVKDITVDASGCVLITGRTDSLGLLTLKYSDTGELLWMRNLVGLPWCGDGAAAMVVDQDCNVYVTGRSGSMFSPFKVACITLKYSPHGALQWLARYCEHNDGMQRGNAIVLDARRNVIVAGQFYYGDQDDAQFLLLRYQQTEENVNVNALPLISPVQIPAEGGSFDYILSVSNQTAVGLTVNVWWKMIFPQYILPDSVFGAVQAFVPAGANTSVQKTQQVLRSVPEGITRFVTYAGTYPDFCWSSDTIEIEKLPPSSVLQSEVTIGRSALGWYDVHPNPFNPTTSIRFDLDEPATVDFTVYNTSGSEVYHQHSGYSIGSHEIVFDGSDLPSGVYLYRITVGDWSNSGKMVLLK